VLTKQINDSTKTGSFSKVHRLKDQIRRAVVSTMRNIAEGSERGDHVEFIHFLTMAKGSAAEVRSQLHVAFDQNYIPLQLFEELVLQADEISRMILGLINYLKQSGMKGSKFKRN
jgi:four helix bundle protein